MNCQTFSSIVSVLFHTTVIILIVQAGSLMPKYHKPVLIDFSIEKVPAPAKDVISIRKIRDEKKPEAVVKKKILKRPLPVKNIKVMKAVEPAVQKPEMQEEQVVQKESDIPLPVIEAPPEQVEIPLDQLEEDAMLNNEMQEDFTSVDDVSEETAGKGTSVSEDTSKEFRANATQQYIIQHFKYIRRIVQNNISYPYIAKKMSWEGRVTLSFLIKVDGSVQDICLEKSSGYDVLDTNAKETVMKTAPFPPPVVEARIILPIVYRLL